MKKTFFHLGLTLGLLGVATMTLAQMQEGILIAPDSTWAKETFEFPISFAPELPYTGFEEAWFPKNWIKKDSAAFWSYAFGWKIEAKSPLTGKSLKSNLQTYFDGLVRSQSQMPDGKLLNTNVLTWNEIEEKGTTTWRGKIRIYDAFSTKAPLELFVTIEQAFSPEKGFSILLFRFSPQAFNHGIWKELKKIRIQAG